MASIIYGHDGNATYISSCKVCLETIVITVSGDGYAQWRKGAAIQDALPQLTPDEREFLISQICGPCYNVMFPEER